MRPFFCRKKGEKEEIWRKNSYRKEKNELWNV